MIRIAPKLYRITSGADITRFNAEVYVYLMHIEEAPAT